MRDPIRPWNAGVYTPELLHARERMLDEVESALSAFARDLELLQRWLGRAFDDGLFLGGESSDERSAAP